MQKTQFEGGQSAIWLIGGIVVIAIIGTIFFVQKTPSETPDDTEAMMEEDKMHKENDAVMDDNMKEDDGSMMQDEAMKKGNEKTMEEAGDSMEKPDVNSPTGASPTSTPAPTPKPTPASESTIKTLDVTGKDFAFSVSEIRVKKGDTVKINFTSTEGFHDWVVDEFNAKTERVDSQTGAKTGVQFIADKTGTFEYYCSVGQHRKFGMVGKLIVE